MSDSVRPHRWQPTRLPLSWDSTGKNTGLGCHFLLQYNNNDTIHVHHNGKLKKAETPSAGENVEQPGFLHTTYENTNWTNFRKQLSGIYWRWFYSLWPNILALRYMTKKNQSTYTTNELPRIFRAILSV